MTPGQPFDINTVLAPYGVSSDDFYVFGAALAAFFTVVLIGKTFVIKNDFSGRIKLLQERRKQLKDEITAPKRRQKNRQQTVNLMRKVVTKLHLLQKSQSHQIAAYLVTAGIRGKDTVIVFTFAKLVAALLLPLLSVLLLDFTTEDGSMSPKWLIPLCLIYLGYKFPIYIVSRKRKKRYLALQRALADTLDLLMICAEAGLSLAQGLDRVARELQMAYPEMAEELSLTSIELSFQPDRQKTLNNLAERVQLQEVKGLVNVLVQTEKYGTPISQALRTLSQEFRTQRMLRAEQKAARLPAIMTIPMIIFILPTLFIVVIAPAVINLLDAM